MSSPEEEYRAFAGSRAAAPSYEASYNGGGQPLASATPTAGGHFSSEDLLTEDDIPF